jgi:putative transposase
MVRHRFKNHGERVLRARVLVQYGFIKDHRTEFSVRSMCHVQLVHISRFSAWLKEPLSRCTREDLRQTDLIRQAWTDCGRVYGYHKLHDDLRDQGETSAPTGPGVWPVWRA